jgi:Kef-type K+ transport system membrane component KefB
MDIHLTLVLLGVLFVVGMLTDEIGRRTKLPRVTLLILLGVLAGPVGFDVMPEKAIDWYEPLATVALTMVAFLLGGSLSFEGLRRHGRQILSISILVVVTTVIVVASGLILFGVNPAIALLLAAIATATAPAATLDVIRQVGARGDFVDTLRGIVAVDDAWGLITFSFMLIFVDVLLGNELLVGMTHGLWDLGGSIAIGLIVGFPAAYLTGRLREGEPIQAEALAVVFLTAGLSVWLNVSFLLSGIVAGMIVVNFARHHTLAFHEIENVEWPFMILFFFLAGVSMQVGQWESFFTVIVVLLVLRVVSRLIGGWLGAVIGQAPQSHRRWFGIALLPQAGVAVGMALVASNKFPEFRDDILPITIGVTVVFEIFGPFATMLALRKVGESRN